MTERLKGKTALVLGAGCVGEGWGNGNATAVTFARRRQRGVRRHQRGVRSANRAELVRREGNKADARACRRLPASNSWSMRRPLRSKTTGASTCCTTQACGVREAAGFNEGKLGPRCYRQRQGRLPRMQGGDPAHAAPGQRLRHP